MTMRPGLNNSIRFKDNLIPAVLNGEKTITIRRQQDRRFQPGKRLDVLRDSDGQAVAKLEILTVERLPLGDLDESHARRESMSLPMLKQLITEIYPDTEHFAVISFKLIP